MNVGNNIHVFFSANLRQLDIRRAVKENIAGVETIRGEIVVENKVPHIAAATGARSEQECTTFPATIASLLK